MSRGVSNVTQESGGFVLVGIPAYNEEVTIGEVVTGAQIHADEIVVVDDGSTDDTRARAKSAGATVLAHDENRGYGATLRSLFQYAHERNADHLVILDADGQHDVTDIPDLVRAQRETDAQIVTGSRFTDQSGGDIPTYRRFGLAVINLLTNIGLRVGYDSSPVSDTQCGFRAYSTEAIAKLAQTDDLGSGMGASLAILFEAARNGYTVVDVPTRINYEVENASSQHPVSHGLNLLTALVFFLVRDRPVRLASLGMLSVVSVFAFVFLLIEVSAAMAILVPGLLALGFGFMLALSSRSVRHSDGTDQ